MTPKANPTAAETNENTPAGSATGKFTYVIWSGTTAGGDERVLGYADDLADALKAMTALAPQADAGKDEVRQDWPFPGGTEILRAWFDKPAGFSRWLRATPAVHALDERAPVSDLRGRPTKAVSSHSA